jgi:hypothetical protein
LEWTFIEPKVEWGELVGISQATQVFCGCSQRAEGCGLLADGLSLLRFSALGNPPWLGEHDMLFCRSQVVLSEGHDFFVVTDKEAMRPYECEIGEQGDLTLWSEKQISSRMR